MFLAEIISVLKYNNVGSQTGRNKQSGSNEGSPSVQMKEAQTPSSDQPEAEPCPGRLSGLKLYDSSKK